MDWSPPAIPTFYTWENDIYIIPNNAGKVKSNLKEFEENKYKGLILNVNI